MSAKEILVLDFNNIMSENFAAVHKQIGVLLHDNGVLRYRKLTPKNYEYWWYESDDPATAKPTVYTYNWDDVERTRVFDLFAKIARLHRPDEKLGIVLNNFLQIRSAMDDGFNPKTGMTAVEELVCQLYPPRKRALVAYQQELEL